MMTKKITQEEFLKKAISIHGDRYGYDKAIYIGSKTKITITCLYHGDFQQSPNNHFKGAGCPECANRVKLTHDRFIRISTEKHCGKYDYSQTVFKSSRGKVTIICPIHGIFKQLAKNHLKGHGCNRCARDTVGKKLSITIDEFVKRAREAHGNKFSYDCTEYFNISQKVIITCPIHGDFEQIPYDHLCGHGCRFCGRDELAKGMFLTSEEFIQRSMAAHGDKYRYDQTIYQSSKDKVIITCPIHGDFEQVPSSHIFGHGCGKCAPNGLFDKGSPALLYYLKISHEGDIFYKIGITNRSVNERFRSSELKRIRVIRTWDFGLGRDAYAAEQGILSAYKDFLAGVDNLLANGNTEIFNKDVLGLDE